MSNETRNQSTAAQITGTANWLQLFASPMGDGGGSAPAAAPAAAPASSAPAVPSFAEPGGGFRAPAGQSPLLMAEPAPAAPAPEPQAFPPSVSFGRAPAAAPAQAPFTPPATPPAAPAALPEPLVQTPAAPAAPAAPEVLDFGGRRVAVPADPVHAQALRNLHQDYTNQRAALTRAQQQAAARGYVPSTPAAPPQAPPAAQMPQQAPQPAPEGGLNLQTAITQALSGVNNEQLIAQLYENPTQALGGVLQSVLTPVVTQLQQQMQAQMQAQVQQANAYVQEQQTAEAYNGELSVMAEHPDRFPDLQAAQPLMGQIIQMHPHLLGGPNPMQTIYRMARGYMASQPAAAPPLTVDSVLGNQQLVAQLMERPEIRNQILTSYMQQIRNGQPPFVATGAPGGMAPALPPSPIKTLSQASNALRASMGI